ncbi:hypothetical protein WKW80_22920 [Variovorax humicola]|uniref:Uncharacterized protein n=1 Tax=Variovorax humicola TaxID=1769758 RepID=A0ABU8W4J9_9BURK
MRPVRPDAPDLIVRHLGQRAVGLYASREYLEVRGVPEAGTGLAGHDIVVYDSSMAGLGATCSAASPPGARTWRWRSTRG